MPMFMLANAAVTGPFVGLLLLGLTAPFANSKGAGTVTLFIVAYQLAHMLCRLQSGMREQRMPVSIEYCADNTTGSLNVHNVTVAASDTTLKGIFPLFRLSTHWSSFISAIATYLGGLLLSVLLGRNRPAPDTASNLSSELFLPLWRLLRLMPIKEQTSLVFGNRLLASDIRPTSLLAVQMTVLNEAHAQRPRKFSSRGYKFLLLTGETQGTTKKEVSPKCDPCERVMLTQETTL
ncbi:uncharacterized protein LOC144146624 [Haemaphysalis longicornis]